MNETNETPGKGVEPVAETAPHQADQQPEGKKKPKENRGFQPRPGHVVQAYVLALDPGAETEQRRNADVYLRHQQRVSLPAPRGGSRRPRRGQGPHA